MPDPPLSRREALLRQLRSQFRQATGANQDIDLDAPRLRPPTTRERLTGPVRELLASLAEQPAVQIPLDLMGDIGRLLAPLGARPEVAEMYQMGEVPTGPKAALAAGAEAVAAKAAKPPIRAFHGSPYDYPAERLIRTPSGTTEYITGKPDVLPDVPAGAEVVKDYPFGRMKSEKIGTGEGAQVKGYGLYAAERSPTGGTYKFSNKPDPHLVSPTGEIPEDVLAELARVGYLGFDRPSQALNAIRSDPLEWRKTWDVAEEPLAATERHVTQYPHGRLYELDIHADPETMLDWDKPLSEQSKNVQALFEALPFDVTALAGREAPMAEVYTAASQNFGSPAAATEFFRKAGIPGIRYLDQASRTAGAGTSNYVIFDESKIDILRKLALLLGIGGAGAAASQDGAR